MKFKKYIFAFIYFVILDLLTFNIVLIEGKHQNLFMILIKRYKIVLLAVLFLYAIYFIFYVVTTRFWISLSIPTLLLAIISIADQIKISFRKEPVYFYEIKELVNFKQLAFMIGQDACILLIILLLGIVAFVFFLEYRFPIPLQRKKIYFPLCVASILFCMTPLYFNDRNSPVYSISQFLDNKEINYNPEMTIACNGSLIAFLDSVKTPVMEWPKNYSEYQINKIAEKYKKIAEKINKNRKNNIKDQTIIFNLSESFVDPKSFPRVTFSHEVSDPIKYTRQIMKKSTSGKMLSAGYGGGTGNMEYEALTGFNMGLFYSQIIPYTQIVPKFSKYPTIGTSFSYKVAIHPYTGAFYNRITDYQKFGFNKFVYLESNYKIYNQKFIDKNPFLSDETLYSNALKQINDYKNGQFINLISIQNHTPYNDYYYRNNFKNKINGKFLSNKIAKTEFETYVQGIHYTDLAIKNFISEIDKLNKPITIVFYGDHYPAIINPSLLTSYQIQSHSTNYFIYSNKYARTHGAKEKINKSNFVATSSFIPMMLEQTDSKVTPYQALLAEIYRKLPAITINYNGNGNFELVNQDGKRISVKTLNKTQKKLLHEYQLIQYDMSSGKGFLAKNKYFF